MFDKALSAATVSHNTSCKDVTIVNTEDINHQYQANKRKQSVQSNGQHDFWDTSGNLKKA